MKQTLMRGTPFMQLLSEHSTSFRRSPIAPAVLVHVLKRQLPLVFYCHFSSASSSLSSSPPSSLSSSPAWKLSAGIPYGRSAADERIPDLGLQYHPVLPLLSSQSCIALLLHFAGVAARHAVQLREARIEGPYLAITLGRAQDSRGSLAIVLPVTL